MTDAQKTTGLRLITALLLILGLLLSPTPAHAASARIPVKVITHNMAGAAMNYGVPRAGTEARARYNVRVNREGRTSLSNLENQIDTWGMSGTPVAAVGVQEVCASQYAALREDYPTWDFVWNRMLDNHPSCPLGDDHSIGQVLMSPYPMSFVTITDLGYPDGAKVFRLTCASVAFPGLVGGFPRACVTHLRIAGSDPTGEYKIAQIRKIASTLDPYTSTQRAVIVLGDFNTTARTAGMDYMYRLTLGNSLTGPGDFFEADQTDPVICTRALPCRRQNGIDYAFFSRNAAAPNTGLSEGEVASVYSDHPIIRAVAQLDAWPLARH